MDMVDNTDIADSIDMLNMEKTFGYLKMLDDTSGLARWT